LLTIFGISIYSVGLYLSLRRLIIRRSVALVTARVAISSLKSPN
jgi:hypothetical protein